MSTTLEKIKAIEHSINTLKSKLEKLYNENDKYGMCIADRNHADRIEDLIQSGEYLLKQINAEKEAGIE